MLNSIGIVWQGKKFTDLVITVNPGHDKEDSYLLELKNIAYTDATEAKIQNTIRDAREQFFRYKSAISH